MTCVELGLGQLERDRGGGVARDDDELHVEVSEVADDLERELPDLRGVTHPVRDPSRVPEVDGVLVGQTVPDLRQNRQPTDAGVKYPYGPRIAHGTPL